ncbi:MAG: hypothetical protein Q8O89_00350, partial [Nanoarchaeota archaeon]|nr:hypothetical protein [Nanoarchaeota archaeon]
RHEDTLNILLSKFPNENRQVLKEAIKELKNIADCKVSITGTIRYDSFPIQSLVFTSIPFTLLNSGYQLCVDDEFNLMTGQGMKTDAAQDISEFVQNIIDKNKCGLDKFLNILDDADTNVNVQDNQPTDEINNELIIKHPEHLNSAANVVEISQSQNTAHQRITESQQNSSTRHAPPGKDTSFLRNLRRKFSNKQPL